MEVTIYNEKRDEDMISNQILQNTIDGLKAISKTDFCVADVEGKVVVQTFAEEVSNELAVLPSLRRTARQ